MAEAGRRSLFARRVFRDRLLLALVGAVVFCVPLAATTMWFRHEARFVLTGREMLESGDWVVPRNQGEPVAFYPPLMGWLVACSFAIFGGLSEFAARFPSALAGVGCVVLTFEIGRTLFDRRTGLVAALILLSTMAWNKFVGVCQADVPMVFFLMTSLWAFVRFRAEQPRRLRWLFLLYGAAGLGALAKGPQGPVMTVLVIGAFLAWERDRRLALDLKPWLGALIGVAVVAPWILLVHFRAGPSFLSALWHETFDMAAGGKLLMHAERNPFYYLPILAAGAAPWTIFFIGALLSPRSSSSPVERPSWRFVLSWLLALLVMFSASRAKRIYYMIPLYPALAIVAATWWTRRIRNAGPKWEWVREKGPLAVFWIGAMVVLCAFPFLPLKLELKFEQSRYLVSAVVGFGSAVGLLVSWLLLKGRKPMAFGVMVALVTAGIVTHLLVGVRAGDEDGRRGVAFCRDADVRVGKDPLTVWKIQNYEASYVGAPHAFANSLEECLSRAKSVGSWLVTSEQAWQDSPELQGAYDVVTKTEMEEENMVLLRVRAGVGPGVKR
ncbi:MAG: glycosyltransferase family 39 protein [Planctomycetes bacterium]|nr:glycosyltransferase family 39 protein [Planctomycetota bacterium]